MKLNQFQDGIILEENNISDEDCPFCQELTGKSYKVYNNTLQCDFDHRMLEVDRESSVVVFPDLSPLKYGHVLISTRKHIENFSKITNENCILEFENVLKNLSKQNGTECELFFFEHGTSSCISRNGCVQHTHIHAIPVDEGVYKKVLKDVIGYGSLAKCVYSDLLSLHSSIKKESDSEHYVFFGKCDASSRLLSSYITSEFVPSQLMRHILSKVLKLPTHIEEIPERAYKFASTMDYLKGSF